MLNIRIPEEELELRPRITVVGVGGAGSNGVNNMITSGLQGVEFLVCNTDAQSLKMSQADRKIQMGLNVTRGLGAGARPDVGRAAAEEALDEIMGYIEGSNMVFLTAGMGGGSGTGATPVIARACRDAGILTVGVITKPFHFEGAHRMRLADSGIEELQQHVDTLLIIPNQNLFRVANEKTTFADAFKMADEVLHSGVRSVTDLMVMPGLINLDFADIRAVMSEMGKAMMGTGEASGERRAVEAAEAAINNPLLEDASMAGAKGLLINITGGMDMTLYEVDEACNRIRDEVDPDANIIFGSTFNPELDGKIRVSVVATGIDSGMRAYKTPGSTFPAQETPQPLANQYAAQPKPSMLAPGNFGRGVTLRQGSGQAQPQTAPTSQGYGQNTANTQNPTTRQTGTGTPTARATTMGSYGRGGAASAALRIEEEPLTVGMLEMETAEEVYGNYEEVVQEVEIAAVETYVSAPVQHQQPRTPVQQRGERDGDSFIPPMPMMAETKGAQDQYAPAPRAHAPVHAPAAEVFAENSEPLNAAPARRAPSAEVKRPGLFDRLAGTVRQQQPAAPQQQPITAPVLTVDNSDRMPAGSTSFDDDLDIPAFLRRQAN